MIGPANSSNVVRTSVLDARKTVVDAALLFLISIAVFSVFRITTPANGDTYAYADSMTSFAGPAIHYGYFLIGHLIKSLLSRTGISSLQVVTWMSIVSGSLCVTCMYFFSFRLTGDRLQSALAAAILMFSGTFWFFAEHGEVYVPQLCLILLSATFITMGRPLISCLFALTAVSVTPTSCLAFVPILFVGTRSGLTKRQIGWWFVAPAVGSFAILLLWKFNEIVGILKWAIYSPKIFFDNISLARGVFLGVYQFLVVYLKPFNLLFLAAAWGAVLLWRENRHLFSVMLAFCLPYGAYILNLGLLSGDHLIVTYIAVSLLASYGLSAVLGGLRVRTVAKVVVAVSVLAVHAVTSYAAFIGPGIRDSRELRRVAADLGDRFGSNDIMLSEYDAGMAIWYLLRPEKDFFLLTGRPNNFLAKNYTDPSPCIDRLHSSFWINLPHFAGFMRQPVDTKGILGHRPVYFVDRLDWPSGIIKLLLPEAMLERRRQEIPQAPKIRTELEKAFGEEVRFEKIIDSPLYPVYFVRAGSQTPDVGIIPRPKDRASGVMP